MTDLRSALDRATAEHRLLDHPFYKAWVDGSLTTDDLGFYSAQYWRQVESFPGYLVALADRLKDGPQKAIVESNLSDEVDGDHAGLWIRFASAVGVDEQSLRSTAPEAETAACVESFARGVTEESTAFAFGMLYGYESQTPEVARTKADGLRDRYGVDERGIEYFDLHAGLDVEHSDELATAMEAMVLDDEDRADAERGAAAGAAAVWSLLDGVARVRDLRGVS
ncbi:MAG: TenA family transcriptional regulator [Actinomycetota bacterium]